MLPSRPALRIALATLATATVLAAAGALAFVWGGFYDVSATGPHWRPVHQLLDVALQQAVRYRAKDIQVPPGWADPALQPLGAACFRDRCVACHGAPGVRPEPFALGMQPVPSSLVEAPRHWRAAELYWITRHGIKMSGMPAWEYRLAEQELWAVVAFVEQLPRLTPDRYRQLAAAAPPSCRGVPEQPSPVPLSSQPGDTAGASDARPSSAAGGTSPAEVNATADPATSDTPNSTGTLRTGALAWPADGWADARRALAQHGCIACHQIPGVVGPVTGVGPPLDRLAGRQRIGGKTAPTVDGLAAWIRDPQAVDAHTSMPSVGISETQARLMADYLLKH